MVGVYIMLNIWYVQYCMSQRNHFAVTGVIHGKNYQCRGYRGLYFAGDPRLVCSVSNLEKGEKTL